jgi:hypothetical protein
MRYVEVVNKGFGACGARGAAHHMGAPGAARHLVNASHGGLHLLPGGCVLPLTVILRLLYRHRAQPARMGRGPQARVDLSSNAVQRCQQSWWCHRRCLTAPVPHKTAGQQQVCSHKQHHLNRNSALSSRSSSNPHSSRRARQHHHLQQAQAGLWHAARQSALARCFCWNSNSRIAV